ncbi:putative Ankyrin repeat family protein [Hibiscus syriacus]|uniref:Ankyrin repeat family protein n=1 Tax=Hibiscus syriacus TaxID=106335 RepID=A0A6A2Z458_HIBSY|nr:putative Ankyrin repeat family protein [Hibiscus syriacus]
MKEAYVKLLANDVHGLKKIYHENLEALFSRVTVCRDTIFHVAAYRGSEEMLEMLVKLVPPARKRELIRMKNVYGNTVLHEAATTGKIRAADLLISELLFSVDGENDAREREEILADRNKFGETPLFRAAEYGNKMMVMYLAREIERVGNLHKHYTRDDGVSILHIAVIGQHFDTAIWSVEKYPQLAKYKDNNGKTGLHLLAAMTTAFRSSFSYGIFERFVYHSTSFDSYVVDESDNIVPFNSYVVYFFKAFRTNHQGEPSKARHQSGHSKGFKLYCRFWRCLATGWKIIDRMWSQKKMHSSAVVLANLLVRTDSSWFESHEPEEDDTICLERKEDKEEEVKRSVTAEPDTPLFIAASTGIVEIVEEILKEYPQAIEHINKMGQNILHVVTLHRTYKVYDAVMCREEKNRLVRGIDNHGCTILHHAADTKYYHHGSPRHTPAIKLQQEFKWFEEVRTHVPPHFDLHRNKDNKTADKLFKETHLEQLKTAQEWVKNTSQSCSTVAVLVTAVVFAAAYTAPGGFQSGDGKPVLLEKPLYSFFTVMDVAGLASSLTSVVIFLSILTSSLEFEDFQNKVPRNLSLGFTFLFFSITTTMLTFTATILLLVHLKKTWTAILTYVAAFLPSGIFALFQFPLYYEYSIAAAKTIFDFLRKNMPGNWELTKTSISKAMH